MTTSDQSRLQYWVYDEEGVLFRKFYTKGEAEAFLQSGWTIVYKPRKRIKKEKINFDEFGEPPW